jgi:hypothetical protein
MEKFNPVNPANPDPLKPETSTQKASSESPTIQSVTKPSKQVKSESQLNQHLFQSEKGTGFINHPSPIPPTEGPQFDQSDGWGKKTRDWLGKYGSSVVLPIIAILILAGGIYLYTTQQAEEIPVSPEEILSEATEEIPVLTEEEPETISPTEEVAEKPKIEEIIPGPVKKEGQIIEKAVQGDGVTHLARRALKDYLADHPQEAELTTEHKIYIEDYLKDRIGSHSLEIGDEISFSEDLIQEAIDASLQLNADQLKNLEKYSALVVSW